MIMKWNKSKIVLLIALLIITFTVKVNAFPRRILQRGMRGSDVRELQENLVLVGERLSIDGVFGNKTKEAVINFQDKADLPSDGVVGEQTWEKLEKAISFDEHIVSPGENLTFISNTYNIPVSIIKEANSIEGDHIRPGQELIIPKSGLGGYNSTKLYEFIEYRVQRGDTLARVANEYNTTTRRIKEANELESSNIRVGQRLEIPQLTIELPETSDNQEEVSRDFIWPVEGRITSGFNWRTHPVSNERQFHNGIDIAVPRGRSIKAARSGEVLSSGWIRGYGKTVTIDHGNGVVTLYAHNSKLEVRQGERVSQGQQIALSGSTGLSTGPHLHFEIRIDGDPVNPKEYLE